jgi:hypothetical protein
MAEIKERPPINQEITHLRKRTQEVVAELGEDLVDERDLERVLTDDKYVGRFFRHCMLAVPGDVMKNTERMIVRVLRWRKMEGVSDIKSSDLNECLKNKGSLYLHNRDKDGKQLLVSDVKKHIKAETKLHDLKKLFLYFLERVDREDSDGMVTYVLDCGGSSYKNLDLEFVMFLNKALGAYYPYIVNYILVLDMPWLYGATWNIVKGWLSSAAADKIKFVNKKTIDEFIPQDQQFVTWGGKDDWVYKFVEEEPQQY